MTEIKFQFVFLIDGKFFYETWNLDDFVENSLWELSDYTAETIIAKRRFTTIKDKNSKEIYEGDIVHYLYEPGEGYWNADYDGVISWDSTGFHMKPLEGQSGMDGWLVSLPGAYGNGKRNKLFEIIGNIYETPELLEKQK